PAPQQRPGRRHDARLPLAGLPCVPAELAGAAGARAGAAAVRGDPWSVPMSLTAAQLQARGGKLTASRVAVLMRGDERALYGLWREMTGDPSYVPEDLSGVWPVQLGAVTEALNLSWYARITGHS